LGIIPFQLADASTGKMAPKTDEAQIGIGIEPPHVGKIAGRRRAHYEADAIAAVVAYELSSTVAVSLHS
jgi:hypothetical protein